MPVFLSASAQAGSLVEIWWVVGFIFESFSVAIIAHVLVFLTSAFLSRLAGPS